ncbi:ribosomal protein S18-alanine N-acetyltransferase [Algiphilus sp.]|uniref:ribosomal protein S18-alanine N-acetyltransferase n=1 Tax=Algiphilus sp. TaxID=1872431 RepID=UPI003B521914
MGLAADQPVAHGVRLLPMADGHLDAVHAIERVSQPHPWSRGMFSDCLKAGYSGWVLEDAEQEILAFTLSSLAMDEAHLLNLAVAPHARRHGLGSRLLEHVLRQARHAEARCMLLEVRASNRSAIHLYSERGFAVLARRPRYYPAHAGTREDALVMSFDFTAVREAGAG